MYTEKMKLAFYLSDFPIYYLPWLCHILDSLAKQDFIIDLYLNNAGTKIAVFPNNVHVIELSANPKLPEQNHETKPDFRIPPFVNLLPLDSVRNSHFLSKKNFQI